MEKASEDLEKKPNSLSHREHSLRARIATFLKLQSQHPNWSRREIAEEMNLSHNTLKAYIYQATKAGWLKFEDPLEKLEFELIPKTVENLSYFLDKKDKTVTVEMAKGTIFKQYTDSKTNPAKANTTVLALKIELPKTEGAPPQTISGTVIGRPKHIEGESEEEDES